MIPYKTDTDISSYIIFPRFLIPLELSNDAKVLYALLLDRGDFQEERLHRIGWDYTSVLHR